MKLPQLAATGFARYRVNRVVARQAGQRGWYREQSFLPVPSVLGAGFLLAFGSLGRSVYNGTISERPHSPLPRPYEARARAFRKRSQAEAYATDALKGCHA